MFFVFSKLLLPFIFPLTWILVLLIAGLFFTKKPNTKRKLLLMSLVVAIIFTNSFLLNQFVNLWDIQPIELHNKVPYSCVIVLGGFSTVTNGDSAIFNAASDRFIQGLKLLSMHKASRILITGGNGNLNPGKYRESVWTKGQLKLFNVPDSLILIENKSRNTIENAAFTKTVLAQNNLKPPYILVTSAFHMRRSLGIFQHEKIDVIPYPCNYLAGGSKYSFDQFIPDAYPLGMWNVYIKEIIGTTVNLFKK